MITRLKALLTASAAPAQRLTGDDRTLAAAALLVEAAYMDEPFSDAERDAIHRLLCGRFHLTVEDADALLAEAHEQQAQANHLLRFTRVVKDEFDHAQRVELIEMLWEVIYADGTEHPYESNLMRRIGGLIYVPDAEIGAARQRVLERAGGKTGTNRISEE